MKRHIVILLIGVCLASLGCSDRSLSPPVADVKAVELEAHGEVRIDDYFWLREKENPEVMAYLRSENEYTQAKMEDTKGLQQTLYDEIKGRIKQTDESVPFLLGGFYYYHRFRDGADYPIHCRRKGCLDAAEEVMLDVNQVAEGHEFCSIRGLKVSPNTRVLAYAVDTVGRRKYTVRFRDLAIGNSLDDVLAEMTGNLEWANDSRTLFYTKQHPVTLRPYQVYRHVLGTPAEEDELVFEELDETFGVKVKKTKSNRFLLIESTQTLSSECWYLDADDPTGAFTVIQPRNQNVEYHVDHHRDRFLIRTNLEAPNFKIVEAPVRNPGMETWREVIPHREDVLVESVEVFEDFLVTSERREALRRLRVMAWDDGQSHEIEFDEAAYATWTTDNHEYDSATLRFGFSSLATPDTVFDYDMVTRGRNLLKRDEVLGGFDSGDYVVERQMAPARDGTLVPLSIVYRKGLQKDGARPLLLYGYGSYGSSVDASFESEIVSLLDRGVIYAVAHVRGGQEMGRSWYEDGKLLRKKNTFTDFIDCVRFLVEQGFTGHGKIGARGGSAGGLLMGAVANMEPELFEVIVAEVPWVDVITTMLDPSIPLTTAEYDEWGDPNRREYYDYMLSYSPYDNLRPVEYPKLLVTTGLHDSQVQYWEAAKWVANLRATKTGDNLLLLKTDMASGHGGPSGRYQKYREEAFIYAFILKAFGLGNS